MKLFWLLATSVINNDQLKQPRSDLLKLSGVGPAMLEKLAKIHIYQQADLLFHLPIRYQDRTRIIPIGRLKLGSDVVVEGEVLNSNIQFARRRMLVVQIADGSGLMVLRFFHFNAQQQRSFATGKFVRCFGEIRRGQQGPEMVHPEYRITEEADNQVQEEALTPVYPTTEGIGPNKIRALAAQALQLQLQQITDTLPTQLTANQGLPSLADALLTVHRPPPDCDVQTLLERSHPAQQRLCLEELLAHHLALQDLKRQRQAIAAPVMATNNALWPALLAALPFELTKAQHRVVGELLADLGNSQSTLRLIQGDVGSGKTIVAAAALLAAVAAGYQATIMAPTELLAEQHLSNFTAWFEPLGVKVVWLAGKLKGKARRSALEDIELGIAQVVVGTHAVFQKEVNFKRLGVMVVDEQHRFGVGQRLALRDKAQSGETPHQLIMSATPIPRSMAMIYYADLDISSIDELPPGRQPVKTVAIAAERRDEVIQRISDAAQAGQQIYWVCPLIDESEHLQAQAATDTHEQLAEQLDKLNVGLIHGRMKSQEKEQIMQNFRTKGIDLLVATTVIEVGVDVPNATLMVIENAERLGLSQLHQLRGRVGRGATQSACVLLYQKPLGQIAKRRLDILRQHNDGFEIAQHDLELRGPGEMMGTRQTGQQTMRIADLARDHALLGTVKQLANELMALPSDEYLPIKDALIQRWIGQQQQFAVV